jgi:hypothetical protein
MLVVLGRCNHAPADSMATITVARRAFEHAADVASLAGSCRVPSGKGESCGHMIEVTTTKLRSSMELQNSHQHDRKQPTHKLFHHCTLLR